MFLNKYLMLIQAAFRHNKKNSRQIERLLFELSFKYNLFMWSKAYFSVFSVTWSFRNHSNMLIWWWNLLLWMYTFVLL